MQLIKIKDIHENKGQIQGVPANPRQWKREEVAQLAKSIQETPELFDLRPIIVYDNINEFVVLGGNMRLAAAKHLGRKEVPCEIVSRETSADKLKEIVIKDNGAFGAWDFDALANEWDDLPLADWGVKGVPDTFESENEPTKEVEDVPADLQTETKCKKGDIWQLGKHRLICGDSTDPEIIAKLMNGERAALLLTDPPYGINAVKVNKVVGGGALHFKGVVGYGKKGKNKIVDCTEYKPIIGDDTTETAKANYNAALSYSDNQIIFGGNYFTDFLPPSRCWVVWDKENTGNFADAELAWTSFDKGVRLYHFLWNGLCREGSREVEGKTRVHPTQKPVGLLADILKDFSKENDNILDCFGGSGSTLIACEQLNRKCFMVELDAMYCDVIIARWEKLTGQKAVKQNE